MSEMNLQLGVQFQLLKTDLVAIYEKNGTKSAFLLSPTDIKERNAVSLADMVADFTNAFGNQVNTNKIKDGLNSLNQGTNGDTNSNFNLQKLKFILKTAYIYKNENTTEYAFAIEVDCGDAIPDLGFIKIEKLAFKIWNTEKNKILKDLELDTIENILKKLDKGDNSQAKLD